jgi:UrcA family protein
MNRFMATILATTLAATAQLASAGAPDDLPRHVEVRFSDLNPGTPEGAVALYQRLQSAAQRVCAEDGTRDLGSVARSRACVSSALAAAITQVDRPLLTAYYQSLGGISTGAVRQASR